MLAIPHLDGGPDDAADADCQLGFSRSMAIAVGLWCRIVDPDGWFVVRYRAVNSNLRINFHDWGVWTMIPMITSITVAVAVMVTGLTVMTAIISGQGGAANGKCQKQRRVRR